MSTRATIRFKDEYEEYFIYRHCDGFPDVVEPDIINVIKDRKDSWSGSEVGKLVSCFIGMNFNHDNRVPAYELTESFHGDESFKYFVNWNEDKKQWELGR